MHFYMYFFLAINIVLPDILLFPLRGTMYNKEKRFGFAERICTKHWSKSKYI